MTQKRKKKQKSKIAEIDKNSEVQQMPKNEKKLKKRNKRQ